MQFDLLRAFPYPVLRPNVDDYVEGDIQTTVTFEQSPDSLDLRADIHMVVSVPEITALVTAGKAEYVVVFACRDTYFRKAVSNSVPEFEHSFPSGMLRAEVLIYPYVVATSEINGFVCPWINDEFGTGPFAFEQGSVLALDEPQSIYLDRETLKPISSAFLLVANENLTGHEWHVDPSADKVRIEVSPDLKERIDVARNEATNKAILLNSLYFGAVMQCLSYLKHQESEHETYRWAQIIRQKCHDMNLSLENHDEAVVAQHLMKYPFALVDTYCFGEVGG